MVRGPTKLDGTSTWDLGDSMLGVITKILQVILMILIRPASRRLDREARLNSKGTDGCCLQQTS